MLKISNVETFYGKIQALRGVDIDVNDGEIVSLIGSNGAGKSTLLMTISGVNKALLTPLMVINKVDLPAPFEPIRETISPSLTSMSTPLRACIFP